MTDAPPPEAAAAFDEAIDNAAREVLTFFEFVGMPDEDDGTGQRAGILAELREAINGVMRQWL